MRIKGDFKSLNKIKCVFKIKINKEEINWFVNNEHLTNNKEWIRELFYPISIWNVWIKLIEGNFIINFQ